MARRYDSRTTIFSPEGRLYQVEYAMEAISNAGAALGILAKDGVVLAAEKKILSKRCRSSPVMVFRPYEIINGTGTVVKNLNLQLLDTGAVGVRREKMYKLDDHIACAVAGITSDANILINTCRLSAQRYQFAYQEPIPVEQLVRALCDNKQGYTQFGGLRPFGVSLLYAGWDEDRGFQLYQSDPSGNYGGWKATAIGNNHQAAQNIMKQDYKEDITLEDAVKLVIKVLNKTMDSTTLSPDKVELATIARSEEHDKVIFHIYRDAELKPLLDSANEQHQKEKEEEA